MRQLVDEVTWLITKTVQIVALLCAISYGMTGWVEW